MAFKLPPAAGLTRVALDLFFPRWCVGCGKEGEYICGECNRTLKTIIPPVCPRCGRPVVQESSQNSCPGCAGWQEGLDGVRAPFLFEGVIREAVHEFKYNNLRALAPELATLMYQYIIDYLVPGEVLVPVPLHPKKLKERGYNQSDLLAEEVGGMAGLPVIDDCLVRTKYTSSQARSTAVSERQRNVTGAFACRDGRLKDKKVILIDDVSTSGATLNACAGVLKSYGAETVWALVVALDL
jgi:competence protein ComFC